MIIYFMFISTSACDIFSFGSFTTQFAFFQVVFLYFVTNFQILCLIYSFFLLFSVIMASAPTQSVCKTCEGVTPPFVLQPTENSRYYICCWCDAIITVGVGSLTRAYKHQFVCNKRRICRTGQRFCSCRIWWEFDNIQFINLLLLIFYLYAIFHIFFLIFLITHLFLINFFFLVEIYLRAIIST